MDFRLLLFKFGLGNSLPILSCGNYPSNAAHTLDSLIFS